VLAAAVAVAVGGVVGVMRALPAASTGAHRAGSPGLPAQVFAPYFEAWDTANGGLARQSAASGAEYLTLAFLQADKAGSCSVYWDGSTSRPVSATAPGSFGADIAAVQRAGGNVIPSFGGYAADATRTELADSCPSVDAIAKVYESLVTTYHAPRIDLDVEAGSQFNKAGIQRRNKAIARAESWAAAHGQHIEFSYTLPAFPTGLTAAGLAVLRDAVAEHAKISVVNVMTFDYYLGKKTQNMLADTESAAAAVHAQLAALYPGAPPDVLWREIGVTEMPGVDDRGAAETFSTTDAAALLHWAASRGIGEISFWALQRDNGSCPGTKARSTCSGVKQPPWYFSHALEPFSHPPARRAHR
jgi:hypothetical protein